MPSPGQTDSLHKRVPESKDTGDIKPEIMNIFTSIRNWILSTERRKYIF